MWNGTGGGGGGAGGWQDWGQTQQQFQAMPHGHVDWAALAQQWIHTKDSGDGAQPSEASQNVAPPGEEEEVAQGGGGEASMELCDPGGEDTTTGW